MPIFPKSSRTFLKGPSLYANTPLKQKKTSGFGPRAAEDEDDQSIELAKSRYEMGQYKNDPTKPPTPPKKKKKPNQGDFVPAYPGADISKEEYEKRLKSGSTKRD